MIEAEITKSVIQKGNKKEESFEVIFYLFVLVPNSHGGYTMSYPVTLNIIAKYIIINSTNLNFKFSLTYPHFVHQLWIFCVQGPGVDGT